MRQPRLKKPPTDTALRGLDRCRLLSGQDTDRTKKMEIFRWAKGMLLGVILIIAFRLFAEGLGWREASTTAAYIGVVLLGVGLILALVGSIMDRNSVMHSHLEHSSRGKYGKK